MQGSGSVIGGEISDLHGLHTNLHSQSQAVDDLMAQLTSNLDSTWWKGGAADRFRESWESDYKPALKRLSQALVDAGDEVRARKDALIHVGS